MNDKIKTKPEVIAESHWDYIKELLLTHKVTLEDVGIIGFHYKSAFIHGWKHAIEELEDTTNGY